MIDVQYCNIISISVLVIILIPEHKLFFSPHTYRYKWTPLITTSPALEDNTLRKRRRRRRSTHCATFQKQTVFVHIYCTSAHTHTHTCIGII